MKIGFIGAGKVGCSLGKYLNNHGSEVTGYYDNYETAAKEAADFTNSRHYKELLPVVKESDALFLTVPDGIISVVWEQIKSMPIEGHIICHCSGALTAQEAFSGISGTGAYGCSVHPLFAVSDKYHSFLELSTAYFTMEGDFYALDQMMDLFRSLGNGVQSIDSSKKRLYHAAAAICSNQVTALANQSIEMLCECGFTPETARKVLKPIMCGNLAHVAEAGPVESLTGPVERCDVGTLRKHVECLPEEEDQILYVLLSKKLIKIAEKKNPDRDYEPVQNLCEKILQRNYEMMSKRSL
ncbi:MAG: DUF2520 domain-containing protein [Lachnospiraceae bacterium]|nr:DUF2520 domain-containing protein [Lachnospiraceae bacterium]